MKTITTTAIAVVLCLGGMGAAYADRDDGPEFPDTRDAGTYHSLSACREAGDRAVSNRQARSYNCTLAPGANYKLRINPKF